MDLPKELQFLVEQTLIFFGESCQYQAKEKFACQQFIDHSFDSC